MLKFLALGGTKSQLSGELSSLECLISSCAVQLFGSFLILSFASLISARCCYFGLLIRLLMSPCFSSFSLSALKVRLSHISEAASKSSTIYSSPFGKRPDSQTFYFSALWNEGRNDCWHFLWHWRVWSGQMRRCLLNREHCVVVTTQLGGGSPAARWFARAVQQWTRVITWRIWLTLSENIPLDKLDLLFQAFPWPCRPKRQNWWQWFDLQKPCITQNCPLVHKRALGKREGWARI